MGLTSWGLAELSVAGGAGAHAVAVLGNVRSSHMPTSAVDADVVAGRCQDCFPRVLVEEKALHPSSCAIACLL